MRAILFILAVVSAQAFGVLSARELRAVYSEAAKLQDANALIERGHLSIAELTSRGFLQLDPAPVFQMRDGVPNPDQPTGFRRILLPTGQTGILIPEEVDLSNPHSIDGYDGYAILSPGIGTDRSNAMSLIAIGQELKSGKYLKSSTSQRKLKLLPILVDSTLSGMAGNAPLYFGEPVFATEVIRHVHLLVASAFPWAKCIVGGRSQGALFSMEYAQRFGGVAGVIAMSPSPTRSDLHAESMRLGDANLATMMDTPLTMNRSDFSYRTHTTGFRSFGVHNRLQSLERHLLLGPERAIPLILLLGAKDQSYPPAYFDFAKSFVAAERHRELEIFAEGGHDLWSRHNRNLLRSVMQRMADFLEKLLPEASSSDKELAQFGLRLEGLGWSPLVVQRGIQYYPDFLLSLSGKSDDELKPVQAYRGLYRPLLVRNYNPMHVGSAVIGHGYTFVSDLKEASLYSRRIVLEFQIPHFLIPEGGELDRGFGIQSRKWPDNRVFLSRVGFAPLTFTCAKLLAPRLTRDWVLSEQSVNWVPPMSVVPYE